MHMYNFLCSDSLLYFFLFLSTLHSVYTRDCSCKDVFNPNITTFQSNCAEGLHFSAFHCYNNNINNIVL